MNLADVLNRFAWELLWLTAPIAIMMLISLPETSAANILLRRAHRLRKLTGRSDLRSQSEIDQDKMTANEVLFDALIKPWEINLLDPAVVSLYTNDADNVNLQECRHLQPSTQP